MGWKSLAWAGCLAPALAGCGAYQAGRTSPDDAPPAAAQRGADRDPRADARAAWKAVRAQYPRRAFSAEFHDGFLDGFAGRVDGGAAVPPVKYLRGEKYYTPEGQRLIREYRLGFQYGGDVAAATSRQQSPAAPVPQATGSATASAAPVAPAVPFVPARPAPRPPASASADRAPQKPDQRPAPSAPGLGSGNKFATALAPPEPDLLPIPYPPLPVPSGDDASAAIRANLPVPPDEVPTLPASAPTPSILDDLPVIPFHFLSPPPLPVTQEIPPQQVR